MALMASGALAAPADQRLCVRRRRHPAPFLLHVLVAAQQEVQARARAVGTREQRGLVLAARIEQRLFVMFLEHRMRTFQGSFHNNPDYALWYGWSEMQRDLTEIPALVEDELVERRGKVVRGGVQRSQRRESVGQPLGQHLKDRRLVEISQPVPPEIAQVDLVFHERCGRIRHDDLAAVAEDVEVRLQGRRARAGDAKGDRNLGGFAGDLGLADDGVLVLDGPIPLGDANIADAKGAHALVAEQQPGAAADPFRARPGEVAPARAARR